MHTHKRDYYFAKKIVSLKTFSHTTMEIKGATEGMTYSEFLKNDDFEGF